MSHFGCYSRTFERRNWARYSRIRRMSVKRIKLKNAENKLLYTSYCTVRTVFWFWTKLIEYWMRHLNLKFEKLLSPNGVEWGHVANVKQCCLAQVFQWKHKCIILYYFKIIINAYKTFFHPLVVGQRIFQIWLLIFNCRLHSFYSEKPCSKNCLGWRRGQTRSFDGIVDCWR